MKTAPFILGSILLALPRATVASEPSVDGVAFFDQHIHPVLEQSCFPCHGLEKVEGGLALTNREGLMKGGTRGPGINVSDLPNSVLLKMINHDDLKQRMPFQQPPLSAEKKAAFEKWVLMGAPYNPDREVEPKVGQPRGHGD